jgi:hypothetical protein
MLPAALDPPATPSVTAVNLRGYLPLAVFVLAYLLLTVAGNVAYFLPGSQLGSYFVRGFSIHSFQSAGTLTYWALLLMPFLIAPPVALATRSLFCKPTSALLSKVSEFGRIDYTVITAAAYLYAGTAILKVDALGQLASSTGFEETIVNRLSVLAALGFWPQVAMKSILIFLSCYGLIRALRSEDRFWKVATILNIILMTLLLTLLNMKWPLLVFYGAMMLACLFYASRRLPSVAALACMIVVSYSVTSVGVARSLSTMEHSVKNIFATKADGPQKGSAAKDVAFYAVASILNRMAQPFPYYVEEFSRDGQKCGTILDRIKRKPGPCHPSSFVYSAMFKDAFAGTATAPQAVHVTGYALDSWTGAILALVLASIVIGAFMAASTTQSAIAATVTIMGGLTGYYFSQLPFEGAIIYDHGVLWWGLLVGFLMLKRALTKPSRLACHCR